MALVQLILKPQPNSAGASAKKLVKKKTEKKATRTRYLYIFFCSLWMFTFTLIGGLLHQRNRILYGLFGGLGFALSLSLVLKGLNDFIMHLPRKSNIYSTLAKISHYTWFEASNGETGSLQIESFNLNFTVSQGCYKYPLVFSHQVQGNRKSSRRFAECQEIFVYYTMIEQEGKQVVKFRMKFQFHDIKLHFFLFLGGLYLSTCCLVLSCSPSSWHFLQMKSLFISLFTYLIIVFLSVLYVRQNPDFDFEIRPTKRILDPDLLKKEVTAGLSDYLPDAIILLVILPFFDKEFWFTEV